MVPAERLRQLRLGRLRRLAVTAARTRWYSEVFRQAGVTPGDFVGEEVLLRLPLLDRAALRDRGREAMLTLPAETLSVLTTSGSTGQPIRFFRSAARDQAEISALWTRLWGAYVR